MIDYIPDLTERYPEGFNGADTYEPYDEELAAWDDFERSCREEARRVVEYYDKQERKVLKQGAKGLTLAETVDAFGNKKIMLCTIKGGHIVDIYDMGGADIPENIETLTRLFYEYTEE